ncbi:MAG: hypothetical protein WDA24_10670 [Tissierellales bacterium]
MNNKNTKSKKTTTMDMEARNEMIKKYKRRKIIELCITILVIGLAVFLYIKGYDPTAVLVYLAGKNLISITRVIRAKGKAKNQQFLLIINSAGLFIGILGAFNLIKQLIK